MYNYMIVSLSFPQPAPKVVAPLSAAASPLKTPPPAVSVPASKPLTPASPGKVSAPSSPPGALDFVSIGKTLNGSVKGMDGYEEPVVAAGKI